MAEFADEAFPVTPGAADMFLKGVVTLIVNQEVNPDAIRRAAKGIASIGRIMLIAELMDEFQARPGDVDLQQSQDVARVRVRSRQFAGLRPGIDARRLGHFSILAAK